MKQTRFIIGLGILVLALIAFKMEFVLWTVQVGSTYIQIYPTYGLVVLGGLVVIKEIPRDRDNLYLFWLR